MSRSLGWLSAVALGSLSSLLACGLLFPTELQTSADASPADAQSPPTDGTLRDAPAPDDTSLVDADAAKALDGARREASADGSVCVSILPPPPPTSPPPGEGVVSFVAALRVLVGLSPTDAGSLPSVGFDLDNVCTCEPAAHPGPPSCTPPTTPAPMDCDQSGGRDLQGDQLLQTFNEAFAATSSGDLLARIEAGQFTLLLAVDNYNGQPDDAQVSLAAFASSGIDTSDAGGSPRWDGTDVWYVDPGSVAAHLPTDGGYGYIPVFSTTTAYVTQGVLVAMLPTMQFEVGFGIVPLRDVVLAATMTANPNGGYDLNGQFGARFKTSDALGLVGRVNNGDAGPLCGSNLEFLAIRSTVCQTADIMASAQEDNMGKTCDAFSLGVGFQSVAAHFGPTQSSVVYEAGCDGAIDDCVP